jgi:hypothetical protein
LTGKGFFNNLQGASSPTAPIIFIKAYSFEQTRKIALKSYDETIFQKTGPFLHNCPDNDGGQP